MSLKTRVLRLEKLAKRPASVETDANQWLVQNHADTLHRYDQSFKKHGGDQNAALRELSDLDLNILIDAFSPQRRTERARWNGVIERIRTIVTDSDFECVAKFLGHQFDLDSTAWRWPVITYSWLSVCPPSLRGPSIAALNGNQTCGPYPWLEVWLRNLVGIYSRLPPTISSECIGELVQIRIAHAAGTDHKTWYDVRSCDECGLLRPNSIKTCPHCAATGCSWNGERFAAGQGWRGLAESELAAFDWGKPVSNEVAISSATRLSTAARRT